MAPRLDFFKSCLIQLVLSALLQPADNFTWFNHAVTVEILVHILFYLLHYSTAHHPEHPALIHRMTKPNICFWTSFICVILMSVALMNGYMPVYFGIAT